MDTTTTTRKTAKYYRDIFNGGNVSLALSVLPEVIKKFGSKRWAESKYNDILYLKDYTEFEWNHQIESFFLTKEGRVAADIYWQGDSTDGNTSEWASVLATGKVIPAKSEFDGYRTYYEHSDLRISREEFADAIKAVGKYLSPDEMKKRKIARNRGENSDKIFAYIDAKKKSLDRWEMSMFWNARFGVQKVLENNRELLDKPFSEVKSIIDKVYSNNFRESSYGRFEYNLTY